MRVTIILIAVLLSFSNRLTAQTRTIYGRVIDEDMETLRAVRIQNKDKLELGTTGIDGRFKIEIPKNTQTLILSFIGFENSIIKLNDECDTVEVVMMLAGTYDFMSSREIDRDRLKTFNKLPELHLQAYKKRLFTKEPICYTREFEPEKPRLDSIGKEYVKMRRKIKLTFEKLNIGDTVKIPFAEEHYKRTDTTTLMAYTDLLRIKDYDCIVKCVITGKNKHKRGYNIVCKVVDCGNCKDPSVFRDKVMKPGEVLAYNMKYFKILEE